MQQKETSQNIDELKEEKRQKVSQKKGNTTGGEQ